MKPRPPMAVLVGVCLVALGLAPPQGAAKAARRTLAPVRLPAFVGSAVKPPKR